MQSLPLLYRGINNNEHDLNFHLMRIEGIVREMQSGHFPCRIGSAWLGGYGYPVSVYYGDVLLYIPAILRILGLNIYLAYKVYVIVINLLTTEVAYKCFSKMFRDVDIGILCALAYSTASYRMVDVFIRSAVGEYSVMLFFPIVAIALSNIYSEEHYIRNATLLAIGMAGIVTSHVLSTQMVLLFVIITTAIFYKKALTVKAVLSYCLAVVECMLLSAFFWVPFIDYYVNETVMVTEDVKTGIIKKIQYSGIGIADLFAFFSNPFGGDGYLLATPGMILMGALIVAIYLWCRHKLTKVNEKLVILSILALFMATNVFPWNMLAYKFGIINKLAQVQFPWRYLVIAILYLTTLLGSLLKEYKKTPYFKVDFKDLEIVLFAVSALIIVVFTSFYSDEAYRTIYYDTFNLDTYYIEKGEYLRAVYEDKTMRTEGIGQFDGEIMGKGVTDVEDVSRNGTDLDFYIKTSDEGAVVSVPITNYKGYRVFDDNDNEYEIRDGENFEISFELPAGFDGDISVMFVDPWYWTVALGISAVAWMAIVVYFGVIYVK